MNNLFRHIQIFPENMLPCPTFDETAIRDIRAVISHVFLITWLERHPTNLGDPSHGKLKADNYFVPFTAILPLHLVEYWTASPTQPEMLDNFCHLVTGTNIFRSYASTKSWQPYVCRALQVV